MKNNKKYHYTSLQIKKKLKKLGVKRGDTLFIHSNLAFFGRLNSKKYLCEVFVKSICEVIEIKVHLLCQLFLIRLAVNLIRLILPLYGIFSNYLMSLKKETGQRPNFFSLCNWQILQVFNRN